MIQGCRGVGDGEQLAVEPSRGRDALPDPVRAALGGGDEQHLREEAAAVLFDPGRPVAVVDPALAHDRRDAVRGEVDFDEPLVLEVAGPQRDDRGPA